jgi:pimeloyl-ACP methyl ester carboxylesterase
VIVEGAGHWPHREDPAAFQRALMAFLTRLEQGE